MEIKIQELAEEQTQVEEAAKVHDHHAERIPIKQYIQVVHLLPEHLQVLQAHDHHEVKPHKVAVQDHLLHHHQDQVVVQVYQEVQAVAVVAVGQVVQQDHQELSTTMN